VTVPARWLTGFFAVYVHVRVPSDLHTAAQRSWLPNLRYHTYLTPEKCKVEDSTHFQVVNGPVICERARAAADAAASAAKRAAAGGAGRR